MTPQQVQTVQKTVKLILPAADSIAALLYKRLFALEPTLKALFHNDLEVQGGKLMATLILIVQNLDQPDRIVPAVRALGQRHVNYGVQPEDYRQVGRALQWALRQELGQALTEEMAEAWTAVYDYLASIMQAAAAEIAPYSGLSYQADEREDDAR